MLLCKPQLPMAYALWKLGAYNMIGELLKDAIENVERAILEYLPHYVYIAYSGGRDSAALLDIIARLKPHNFAGVMAIDTGLSCDGWADMIRQHTAANNLPVDIVTGRGWAWYEQNVMDYGFGYTPNQHVIYYRMLKERAIHSHIAKHPKKTRIMYLTGVRRDESIKRQNTPISMVYRRRITVNPLVNFTGAVIDRYLSTVAKWWNNPYYDTVGSSGDCLCGWTCKNSAQTIERVHPEIGGRLVSLSNRSVSAGLWPYGVRGDKYDPPHGSDTMPPDSLCVNCSRV